MSNSSAESDWWPSAKNGWRPSPACNLPSPAEITETHALLHARLFEAARLPMLPPESNGLVSLDTMKWGIDWAVDTDKPQSLHIKQHGPFGEPPTIGTLRTNAFTVGMGPFAGLRGPIAHLDVFQDGDGKMIFDDRGGYSAIYPRMSDEQIELGIRVLRAFLNGEIPADYQRLERCIRVTGMDGVTVKAEETAIWQADELLYSGSYMEVKPGDSGDFSFVSRLDGDKGHAFSGYNDIRDYDGPFGIKLGYLALGNSGQDLRDLGASARIPWRLARDHYVFRTRRALTTGRLKEVRQCVEAGLGQLAQYHDAYVAQSSQPERRAGSIQTKL
jgi:hypothetical protein